MSNESKAKRVERLIANLRDENDVTRAQAEVWNLYFNKLCHVARAKLKVIPRAPSGAEDVALSALNCMFDKLSQGDFSTIKDADDLWRMLVRITKNRANNRIERELAQKRGGGKVRGESVFLGTDADISGNKIAEFAVDQESNEFVQQLSIVVRDEIAALPDEELRKIATEWLSGKNAMEIAEGLGCSKRKVERAKKRMLALWQSQASDSDS